MKTTNRRKATLQWRRHARRIYRKARSFRQTCRLLDIPVRFATSLRQAMNGDYLKEETLNAMVIPYHRRYHDLWSMPIALLAWKMRHREEMTNAD